MSDLHSTAKPAKPYPDFPLFAHATGRWAKKIRGRLVYFGKWADPDVALQRYLADKEDLHAGRTPRASSEALTLYILCGRYLTAKKQLLDAGEVKARTFGEYAATCRRLLETFGKNRLVSDLRPDDFERLRAAIAKTWGPVRLSNEITRVKGVFRYATLAGFVDRPIPIGPSFAKPKAKVLRLHRQARGPRAFTSDELRTLLAAAGQPLRAMILAGINCGFGNLDVGSLLESALDLDGGWVNYPRPKTGIVRRCPLWPETVAAIRESMAQRAAPKMPAGTGLVFLTRFGRPWATDAPTDVLGTAFRRLCIQCGVTPRGFYGLRHSFQTVGDESGDFLAVRSIMGHAGGADIADHYRERLSDKRLLSVTEHVRQWVFGEAV